MFDFDGERNTALILDPATGQKVSQSGGKDKDGGDNEGDD